MKLSAVRLRYLAAAVAPERLGRWLAVGLTATLLGACGSGEAAQWRDAASASPSISVSVPPEPSPSVNKGLMVALCDELEERAAVPLQGGKFDPEEPEILAHTGDMLDGAVLCGRVHVDLPRGLVGSPLSANVRVVPVRLQAGESTRRWLDRYLKADDDLDVAEKLEPLSGFVGAAWSAQSLEHLPGAGEDPRRAFMQTYAFAVPYMVYVSVVIWFDEGSSARALQLCMKVTKVLVRESLEVLSE